MADIRSSYSKYVKFILINYTGSPLEIDKPIGWNDNGLDAARNLKYHGAITEVTKELQFIGEAKDYILDEYRKNAVIAKIGLARLTLRDDGDDVKWTNDFIVNADFHTMKIKRNLLKLKFNSNKLMDLIDAHDGDEFELDIEQSINDKKLPDLIEKSVEIKGRSLLRVGKSTFITEKIVYSEHSTTVGITGFLSLRWNRNIQTPKTIDKTFGADRFSTVDDLNDMTSGEGRNRLGHKTTAGSMFYVNDLATKKGSIIKKGVAQLQITIKARIELSAKENNSLGSSTNLTFKMYLRVGTRQDNSTETTPNTDPDYLLGTKIESVVSTIRLTNKSQVINVNKTIDISVKYNEGVLLQVYGQGYVHDAVTRFNSTTGTQDLFSYEIKSGGIDCSEVAYFEPSPSLRFIFINDVFARLMHIITGNTKSYFSSYFGRVKAGYQRNGFGSHIALISGLWVRAFDKEDDKYKAPKISLDDCLTSCINVFNLGAGIETTGVEERLIVEDVDFFYRDEVVVKFPNVISNSEYIVDTKSYFSSVEFGYEKSIRDDTPMGLDEPNKKTLFTTPIDNTKNKLQKFSKIRADEYEMELLRRKPYDLFPNESISGDEDNWFLDLRETGGLPFINNPNRIIVEFDIYEYSQKEWSDRLSELPQGIHSPQTFRSMLFTPFRILLRNSSIFNSGLHYYENKYLNYSSSSSNKNLTMKFKEEEAHTENQSIKISDLKPHIFKNERITFSHAMTYELNALLHGKTPLVINGQNRLIPNYYFKFEWTNEGGKTERGFFLKVKNGDLAEFEFQLSSEDII